MATLHFESRSQSLRFWPRPSKRGREKYFILSPPRSLLAISLSLFSSPSLCGLRTFVWYYFFLSMLVHLCSSKEQADRPSYLFLSKPPSKRTYGPPKIHKEMSALYFGCFLVAHSVEMPSCIFPARSLEPNSNP